MVYNYKITIKGLGITTHSYEFSSNATARVVGRVVDLVQRDTVDTHEAKAISLKDILKSLGYDVIDGVHYTETYTFVDKGTMR